MKRLLILLSGLEISDGIITSFLVGNGLAQEGNPLIKAIVMEGNFLLFKVIGVIICVLLLWGIYERYPGLALVSASSIVIFYGAVIVWDLSIAFLA
jgi:hypothetical protein